MTNIVLEDIYNIISCKLEYRYMEIIDAFISSSTKKELVYTSFDGDYMAFIPLMQHFVLKEMGMIPINPEAALGYYLSTTIHHNQKAAVMRDCINLELMCDRLAVFKHPVDDYYPDGVIAETISWVNEGINKIQSVAIISLPDFQFNNSKLQYAKDIDLSTKLDIDEFTRERCNDGSCVDEIKQRLECSRSSKIKMAYLISNMSNYKHLDWVRRYCYENEYCPVSPYNLLPIDLYELPANNEQVFIDYIKDRLTILNKCDVIVISVDGRNLSKNERECPFDLIVLMELYYYFKSCNHKEIIILDYADIHVPKYERVVEWALTKEDQNK